MRWYRGFWLVLVWLMWSVPAVAVIETYDFDNELLRTRYHSFVEELRCPKCQNQNLAGSNSPIAMDLRRELHRLLHEGRSDAEIVEYMVNRYGDFILYRPRFNQQTALLWLAPAIFLVGGFVVLMAIFRRQKKTNQPVVDNTNVALSSAEQNNLARILAQSKHNQGDEKDDKHA